MVLSKRNPTSAAITKNHKMNMGKGVRLQRAATAEHVRTLRDGSGLSFRMITRQLKLPDPSNTYRYYRNSVMAEMRVQWFRLPLALRQRYWRETDYGRKTTGAALLRAIAEALKCIS